MSSLQFPDELRLDLDEDIVVVSTFEYFVVIVAVGLEIDLTLQIAFPALVNSLGEVLLAQVLANGHQFLPLAPFQPLDYSPHALLEILPVFRIYLDLE